MPLAQLHTDAGHLSLAGGHSDMTEEMQIILLEPEELARIESLLSFTCYIQIFVCLRSTVLKKNHICP